MQKFITNSTKQTQKVASDFARKLRDGEIVCLCGDLGAGKTTFTQGLLKGLGVKGPYTSPTFAIVKEYKLKAKSQKLKALYHIDAYRIGAKDLLELGWNDFAGKENAVTIIEWPENVKKIIPTSAVWIKFEWISEKERKITIL